MLQRPVYKSYDVTNIMLSIHYEVGEIKKTLVLNAPDACNYLYKTDSIEDYDVGKNIYDSTVYHFEKGETKADRLLFFIADRFNDEMGQRIVNWHESVLQYERVLAEMQIPLS